MNHDDFSTIFSLRNEHALITGGGTGIGLAVARTMHAAGAKLTLVGRREAELKAGAVAVGPNAGYIVHDITELDRADELVRQAARERGPVSVLVNNAGIHLKKSVVETTPAEFQQVLNTHILGAHAISRAVLPGMMERRHGSILFMASMASLFGIPYVVAYSAAKSAMVGMVRTMATEVSSHGVRVNAIAPGWIETEMSRKALDGDPVRKNKIVGRTPMAKLGRPDDIGWAAVYLSSPAAQFVTGVVLPVDGGVSVGF